MLDDAFATGGSPAKLGLDACLSLLKTLKVSRGHRGDLLLDLDVVGAGLFGGVATVGGCSVELLLDLELLGVELSLLLFLAGEGKSDDFLIVDLGLLLDRLKKLSLALLSIR